MAGRASQVVEHLPNKYETLSSKPNTKKKKKKKCQEKRKLLAIILDKIEVKILNKLQTNQI
jgi:hypothetical protein